MTIIEIEKIKTAGSKSFLEARAKSEVAMARESLVNVWPTTANFRSAIESAQSHLVNALRCYEAAATVI